MRKLLFALIVLLGFGGLAFAQDKPLRIIAVFAHPDDADSRMSGTAIQWAKMGHQVKFVSITNGDAGHQETGGARLAQRRRAESEEAARRYGIAEYKTLDNHDAELVPSLDIRKQVIREIREWKADIVVGLRPNDYHPDHRYAGVLVMDAAYMVVVPNSVSDVPALERNPVFLYMQDRFKRPYPFQPDIAVIIDDVIDQKINGMMAHESQYFEWLPWVDRELDQVPTDTEGRRAWLKSQRGRPNISDAMRKSLEKWYGPEKAAQATRAEAFEVAEYGRQPNEDEIRRLFPMLGK